MRCLASIAVAALLLTSGFAPAVTAVPTAGQSLDTPAATQHSDDSLIDSAATVGPDDGPVAVANDTTSRLQLPGQRTGNYSSVSLDFGGTMAMSAERVESQYHVSLVTLQIDGVDSRSARVAVVNTYLDAAIEELDDLAAAEQRAVERYRAGEISAETLLVKLAIVDMRSRAIEDSFTRIRFASSSLPRSTLNRIENVRLELDTFQSTPREHVSKAAAGELKDEMNPMYVTASENGVVVEMLDERRYYRNTVRFDERSLGLVDQFQSVDDFQNRLPELYPWSYDRKSGIKIDAFTQRNLYAADYSHPQGSLVTFVDGATRDVFREEQSLILERLPELAPKTATKENVSVTVSSTPNGGPFRVNVTEDVTGNATAETLDAVVLVNDTVVGRTGADGELWMLSPVGDYEVTVVHDETTINVSVSP